MKKGELFNSVEYAHPRSTVFDLSHDRKMSLNMGELIPSLLIDVLPGDRFALQSSHLMRLAPQLAPVMHEVNVYQHFFFVPNRLVWPNWEKFITGDEDGEDTTAAPFLEFSEAEPSNITIGSLGDYMGLPVYQGASTISVNALPFAAYNKIYNEYYRDQNLTAKIDDTLSDGNNVSFPTAIKKRAWEKDYFTSALPWTQRGVEATIPLGTYADIVWYDMSDGNPLAGFGKIKRTDTGALITTAAQDLQGSAAGALTKPNYVTTGINLDISENHRVDLTGATAATINELRAAIRLQEWLEKNARGGSRYIEMIFSHFGVKSSDARLQRPEYLGGGKTRIQFGEVFQTYSTAGDETPVGEMAGKASTAGASKMINYRAEEHGFIVGIMSVIPRTAYMQGTPKMFLKFDKLDYGWPEFAELGEQEIKRIELWNNMDAQDETFGYTPRYAEYKYMSNTVHGDFRDSLKHWHMAREFATEPNLNTSFVESNPTTRIFADTYNEVDKLWCHMYNYVKAERKLPAFGTPTL